MSRKEKKQIVNRVELEVLIKRYYNTQKQFSEEFGLNYNTLRTFLQDNNQMPKFNEKMEMIMQKHGVDPYAETPELPKAVAV